MEEESGGIGELKGKDVRGFKVINGEERKVEKSERGAGEVLV